jgi:hypothetical protein
MGRTALLCSRKGMVLKKILVIRMSKALFEQVGLHYSTSAQDTAKSEIPDT